MGEKKFTFIELHLDGDTQFGPKAIDDALPFGEKRTDEEFDELDEIEDEEEDAAAAEDDSGGKGGAIGALVALAVLVALGVAAKKYAGDDDEEELPERDQPDVIVN
jgi:hypothetical protein